MAFEHPRLLAASLTVALIGASCSIPNDPSDEASNGTANGATASGANAPDGTPMTGGTSSNPQDPQGQGPQTVAQQRAAALVEHWLDNARRLRTRGELQAAKLELLKAKDLAPRNETVAAQLAAVQAELGEPAGVVKDYSDEVMRLQAIAEERARATVTTQLQTAQQRMSDKDYAGAIEELRRAALGIEIKRDVDWADLPAQVQSARDEAERLYDAQTRESQAAQNAQLADRLRREYERTQAQKRARVDGLIKRSQVAFEARQFERSQDHATRALEIDPSNSLAYEMLNAATKAGRDSANDGYWRARAAEIRKMLEAHEELKTPQTEILILDPEVWARAQGRSARRDGPKAMDPQDAALTEQVATVQVGRLTYTEETGDYLSVINNLSLLTGVQIITTPEARTIIDDESLTVVIELASSMTLKDFLNHMISRSENLAWTIESGVVVIGDKSQAAGTLITKLYSVKELIFKQTQFLPPTIRDIPTEDSGDIPRTSREVSANTPLRSM